MHESTPPARPNFEEALRELNFICRVIALLAVEGELPPPTLVRRFEAAMDRWRAAIGDTDETPGV